MKRLLTISTMLVSSLAMGQWPNLPYNPDDNADGLIGVADLQALLANYGNEFASAVLSNDSSSALIFTGVLQFPVCCQSCDELPGHWDVATYREVGPVWDEIRASAEDTWFGDQPYSGSQYQVLYWYSTPANPAYAYLAGPSAELDQGKRCYCVAKQLPRVEYSACEGSNIQECCTSKVAEGWYPLGNPSSAPQNNSPYYRWNQAFWRWAE
ncbi:MAG: hypothetical protein O2791_06530 [Bacteroidetes bacterium]|nr:hypothetical protein [Bacteroidota bacterium]